jgi:hypothetical protein
MIRGTFAAAAALLLVLAFANSARSQGTPGVQNLRGSYNFSLHGNHVSDFSAFKTPRGKITASIRTIIPL